MTSTTARPALRRIASTLSSTARTLFPVQSPNFYLLFGVTVLLVLLGLVMVLSATSEGSFDGEGAFFSGVVRQVTFIAIGVPLMLLVSRVPKRAWQRWAWVLLGGALFLQLLVFTPLGFGSGGNRNWLQIGPIAGQPSELVKLTLAIWLGAVLAKKMPLLTDWRHAFIPAIPGAAVALGLVLLGHDLGTVVVMSAVVFGALVFAGLRLRLLLGPIALGAAVFGLFAIVSPNRVNRILSFLGEGCTDYENLCWQPLHGTWAMANGGLFGLGLGNSRAKYWLPAASDDYIFAIIGEELGLVGAILVLLLFVLLVIACIRIIRASKDPFVRITTGGIIVWLAAQSFVNIAVVLQLLPVLGVPLPFISAGGTALLTSLLAIGVVLSFARAESEQPPARAPARGTTTGRAPE